MPQQCLVSHFSLLSLFRSHSRFWKVDFWLDYIQVCGMFHGCVWVVGGERESEQGEK